MQLLVLGGTAFVGRHIVAQSLDRGHDVTLFTRGRTNPGLFPDAEHVVGDRAVDLRLLGARKFDAVIDTCGYVPRVVRLSAGVLADRVETYLYVSTVSVYEDAPTVDESSATRRPSDPDSDDVAADYGGLKALCELAVEAAIPDRTLIVRPGLVVGPHDYTGRFTYWPARIRRSGEVLAPGPRDTRVWFIDARDLAMFIVGLVEQRARGVYNAVGPTPAITMEALLAECVAATESDARLTWVTDGFLLAHGVSPFTDLPLWLPQSDGGHPDVDIRKGLAAGLSSRPVESTVRDVLAVEVGGNGDGPGWGPPRPPAGLSPERERGLLEAWRRR